MECEQQHLTLPHENIAGNKDHGTALSSRLGVWRLGQYLRQVRSRTARGKPRAARRITSWRKSHKRRTARKSLLVIIKEVETQLNGANTCSEVEDYVFQPQVMTAWFFNMVLAVCLLILFMIAIWGLHIFNRPWYIAYIKHRASSESTYSVRR